MSDLAALIDKVLTSGTFDGLTIWMTSRGPQCNIRMTDNQAWRCQTTEKGTPSEQLRVLLLATEARPAPASAPKSLVTEDDPFGDIL